MKYKIEKGDTFKCIKNFKMEDDSVEYSKGAVYVSDVDDCITDNSSDEYHDMADYKKFFKYFKPLRK
jgi:hypothetical protein